MAAVQRAQDAQTGYCSDYCSKNQPMGFHEIKEFQKGHLSLQANLKSRDIKEIGKRHASRFLSDAYCKGIVRGQVECCNLRANHVEGQIVAAERVSTTSFKNFPGQAYLGMYDSMRGERPWGQRTRYVKTRPAPDTGERHLREDVTVQAYGHRPTASEVWWLSPYEFTMYWDVVATRVPYNQEEWENNRESSWDVTVTDTGRRKLATGGTAAARLRPQVDYQIRLLEGMDRVCFPAGGGTAALRHNWYLQRKRQPACPHFAHAPTPSRQRDDTERNAQIVSVYFRAWTLDAMAATNQVPLLSNLKPEGGTWEDGLREWLLRLPSEETKQHVANFLSVHRVRPSADEEMNSDNEDVDSEYVLHPTDLPRALGTLAPVQRQQASKTKKDKRFVDTAAAFATAEALWQTEPGERVQHRTDCSTYEGYCPKAILAAARKRTPVSEPQSSPFQAQGSTLGTQAGCRPAQVHGWVASLANGAANAEQQEFCRKVADQIVAEMDGERTFATPAQPVAVKPLRWVLHGGPGTGKSHVLKLLRQGLFEKVLGWTHGVHFQVATFQAVMADLVGGDTIHHAFGLDWSGDKGTSRQRLLELTTTSLQWRWLIIDEFSMISAELLAQLERRCRELVRDLHPQKFTEASGRVQPFGGLNIILAGDLYQLPPPKGTFIGDIPWELLGGKKVSKQAPGLHGQNLIWGGCEEGMQGVTELVQCERTKDAWLEEVQKQLRTGTLSNDNHAFLHGQPTTVCGSAVGGVPTCGNEGCMPQASAAMSPEQILETECGACALDRASRHLVAASTTDPRYSGAFQNAVAIFSTNDVKYHVNKLRARQWAQQKQERVHFAIARDMASATVLREKGDLKEEKLVWLQRHDKECNGLYGVLPLAIGMPVRATDHLDRHRGILKGCQGTIVGWTATPATESGSASIWKTLPSIIYVRFKTSTAWRIDGLAEDNVYPVAPMRRCWYLDRQRRKPELRVTRTQFPLAPGFAITAHVAQGQTIREGVIADLCLADNGNAFTAYVAITRVQGRETIVIFRPFAAGPYQKGVPLGRELLLQHWRGDMIDWKALLAKYAEERRCVACNERKQKAGFTVGQWRRADEERICRECSHRRAAVGTPWQCNVCKLWQPEKAFSEKHQHNRCSFYRVCRTCETRKPCHLCGEKRLEKDFPAAAWKARHAARRICKQCTSRTRHQWTCTNCGAQKNKAEFHSFTQTNKNQNGRQTCDRCVQLVVACSAAAKANARLVRTRRKCEEQRKNTVLAEVQAEIARVVAARKLAGRSVAGKQWCEETDRSAASNPEGSTRKPEGKAQQATAENAERKGRSEGKESPSDYTYKCPFCDGTIESKMATGRISHRQVCGHRFRVDKGAVVGAVPNSVMHTYWCPFCDGTIASPVATGRINHRGVCGHQFRVHNGAIRGAVPNSVKHTYRCPFCDGTIESPRATGRIDHRAVCGHQFRVHNGAIRGAVPNSVKHTYRCPFCEGTIESPLATGCIDHRAVCGHQFRVENGARISSPKHEHPCPACGTLVTSAKATGRIQSSHKDASGNQCGRKEWVVK